MAERAGDVPRQLAQIRWWSERGLARAADSVGRMLGHPVRLILQEVQALSSSTLSVLAGGAALPTAGLQVRIHGDVAGWILILLPLTTVYRILQALMGTPTEPRALTEMERSAVQEVGNVVASSFVSELGDLLGRRLLPSAPEIRMDNFPRLVREMIASTHALGPEVVIVEGRFDEPARHIEGRLFVALEARGLEPVAYGAAGERGGST
ncbi:MAG: hypothetical protein EHM71_08250 [Zetaproteobacteria bacterium]|nr:MAG: hypothetical protein EHM71_08250 [Zetaproteobacteria bacterium]